MDNLFIKEKLPSGLRYILIPHKDSVTTTVLVLVEAGSKYESKSINGISHFLEHMVFKGTKKRTSALAISKELDGIGAHYNAFTSHEWTGYFIKASNQHQDLILDAVSDMYINPLLDEKEIEKEKGVVIEELNMYEDMPQRKVADLFFEVLYGDQPAGWNVGGKKDVVRNLTRHDIVTYRDMHYNASKTIVVLAGNFEAGKMKEKIRQYFGGILKKSRIEKSKIVERQEKPNILVHRKKVDQTHLLLGVRAFPITDKRRYALEILSDYLGGGMSSRLFQRIREELGAAYYVKSDIELLSDHGFLAIAAGVDHSKLEVVIKTMLEEMQAVTEGKFTEHDLMQAKNHLVGSFLISLETSDDLAMFYGSEEVQLKKIETPENAIKKIKKVTKDEVIKVAKDIFTNRRLNLSIILPQELDVRLDEWLKFV